MFRFRCTTVEDHGHCAVAQFVTADNNSKLSLYIYAGDVIPDVGDPLLIPWSQSDHGSVDLGTDGRSAGAALGGTSLEELLPAGISGVDGVASLPVVADPEVHEEGEGAPAVGVIPLSVDISEKPVDAGDIQV